MESKQRNSGGSSSNRRRRARMQKRQQRAAIEEASENEESPPPVRQKRPPARKKRIKEPIFQEDIVDGFAFLCFKTYEDLEKTVSKLTQKDAGSADDSSVPRNNTSDQPPVLEESPAVHKKNSKNKNNNTLPKVKKKIKHINNNKVRNNKESGLTNDESSRPGEEILESQRGGSRDQLSDDGSHASLERGYMCDSESGDERVSEPECDLFNSKVNDSNYIAKKNNPGHSQTCRSPPVLPPIHPVQNGTHHPEPSTAVAAVTASSSPANTSSTMVVGSTSPREPQIGSPAVIPVSCSSTASPPPGVVPPASPRPPFVPPQTANSSKESASGSNKFLNNSYKFMSDTPVPSSRESAALSKPTINVYDFVSDQSAPSSPEGVICISQPKYYHKGVSPITVPQSNSKEHSSEKVGVSNGHANNLCVPAPSPPVLVSPVIQNSHKSALDMTIKNSVSIKTEAPAVLPPTTATGNLRLNTLSSPAHSNAPPAVVPVSPVAASRASPATMRTSVSTSITMSSSSMAHVLAARSRSPVVTASHPNTPTPVPARDTHSSHSNSSLSSLSQLSSTPVHKEREGGSRSHSNSSSVAPPASAALTSASAYASASSLAGLVFSKPQCWSGASNTTNTVSVAATRSSPAPPRASPLSSSGSTSLPLPPTLPPAHHTSPFSSHPGPPPPPLLPVASHHSIFPPGPLTPTLPLEATATAGPSPYRAENLFPQPSEYKKHPDLLRRELDTRFLASQDHSIPIPPPPYMQSEVQHHSQMHQQPPFIAPPPLGAPMVSQPGHLYEKYPKLDSSLYRRPSIGISSYPSVSSLFAPGGGASTPFVPPAHLSLQPKINSVPKTKSVKPGKWCAMHVRIAWEIYNHQQKQKHAEAHKAGIALASVKPPPEHLHPANHALFCSLPRQHELSPFSSSLITAASAHPRSYEASSHPSTFLNPTPAHLGPFARPGYPGFPGTAPGFTGLGPLGIPGPAMLGADLRTGCLTQDPWAAQRTALPFAGGSPWGGLKEEAERDRMQQEQRKREEERQKRAEQERREKEERERREQERREQERRELERQEQERKEQERKEKERREQERRREMERREMERREHERREQERREQERQKERDREIRLHHQLQKNSIIMNGEIRDHHLHHPQHHPQHHPHHHSVPREWERARDTRELPRSPIIPPNNLVKYESPLERHVYPPPPQRMEVKIKQERKDDEPTPVSRSSRPGVPSDDRIRKRPGSIPQSESMDPVSLVSSRNVTHNSVALGLNSIDHSRVIGTHGLVPSPAKDPLAHHSQTSPLWGPLTPSPTVTTMPGPAIEHYRTREMLQSRTDADVRRFDQLVMSQREASNELSRQISNALDLERAAAVAYDRAKLLPPPLRTNESPYATPPTLPPASASSFFSPPVSPYLNSLCSTSGRTKPGPPSMLNGLPPPLIPCTFPVQNHTGYPTTRTSSPMGPHKLMPGSAVLNLPESYFPKERREVNGHPSDFDAHLRL